MNQLALPISLADYAVFASFHAAGNETAVAHLEAIAAGVAGGGAWICGAAGTGKSHLLQATCAAVGDGAVYLPAPLLAGADPHALDGLESRRVILIDDIDRLVGDGDFERALFSLCNALQAQGGQLVVSASLAPRESGVQLPDLASRLSQLPVFRLRALADADRLQALRIRAALRGLELSEDAGRYLLTRSRRDMGSLYALLDTLDREALRAQRRLTVPFVREVLAKRN
jgi:DnaA family protein